MYEVPGSDIVDVIITDDVVRGKAEAQYVRQISDTSDSGYDEDKVQPQEASNL